MLAMSKMISSVKSHNWPHKVAIAYIPFSLVQSNWIQKPILLLLHLHIQRQRCRRLERFFQNAPGFLWRCM
jgi:hypothetical protein